MNNLVIKNLFRKNELYTWIIALILLSGLIVRLYQYIYNRSLWMDEVYLCSGLLHMNYTDLATKTLDYEQKAPIGFLWMVKYCINLWGNSEIVLRFVPFVAGIASLFIYAKVCTYFLKPWAQVIALSIFAFSPALIYHTVEIKQYSTECLATIIALYLFTLYKEDDKWAAKILWGIFGGLLLWFSFSVIFILAGIATGLTLYHIQKKEWRLVFINAVPFLIWLISFVINYLLFTHKHAESEWIVYFFKVYDNFMPFPPHNLQQLKWFPRNFIEMMDYPLGLPYPVVPAIMLFTGILTLFTSNRKNFYVLVMPILFMLLASGLYLYPLLERFWVFVAPILILLLASGFEYYQKRINNHKITIVLMLLIIIGPLGESFYFVIHPEKFYKHKKSFERESLVYINDHFQDGDAVYNYWNNTPGYKVYKNIYRFKYDADQGRDYRKQSSNLNEYNYHLHQDFDKLKGKKRVWLIYNNQFLTDIGDKIDDPKWYYKNRLTPNENLVSVMKEFGSPVKKVTNRDVTVYLFDLHHQ